MLKDAGSTSAEQQTDVSLSQGDDFFLRLQTAFTETGEDQTNFTKEKTRYFFQTITLELFKGCINVLRFLTATQHSNVRLSCVLCCSQDYMVVRPPVSKHQKNSQIYMYNE